MILQGELRRNHSAPMPWQYRGELILPSGRYCAIEASVAEDATGKFFRIRGGLQPGMTSAELEAVLADCEHEAAEKIRRDEAGIEDIPLDELPF